MFHLSLGHRFPHTPFDAAFVSLGSFQAILHHHFIVGFFFLQVYDSCSNHSILSVSEHLRASAAGLDLSVRPVYDSADVL